MKLYDLVFHILKTDSYTRSSDKKLIWEVLKYQGFTENGAITYTRFMSKDIANFESVRRCRQKIQEKYPELRAVGVVFQERAKKAKQKGNFIYREPIKVMRYEGNVAYIE